mgnify:CR=1 FL=1
MTKADFYSHLVQQAQAIIADEQDVVANMANLSALLFDALEQVNWAGFYRLVDNELVLGPFQGKVACIRIPVGKGVCGTAVSEQRTQRIADVHQFSGHIVCDAASNAEIVIPVYADDVIVGVLDIDSVAYERFDEEDQKGLEAVVEVFQQSLQQHGVKQL